MSAAAGPPAGETATSAGSTIRDARLYRRATVAALVAGPALLLVDNLLHPKEYEPGNEARQLAEIAGAVERWQLAHAIGFAALMLYAVAILGLAFLVRRRAPRLGLAGGVLGIAGLMGLSGVIALDGFTWGALGAVYDDPGVDRASVERTLDEVQNSPWSVPFYSLAGAWIAGMIVLAGGLIRERLVPVWAGVLFVVAALATGTETMIVSNAYFIAGAALLLAAGIAIAVPLGRMSDAEFAVGGRG